jgi:hypothetical protein
MIEVFLGFIANPISQRQNAARTARRFVSISVA